MMGKVGDMRLDAAFDGRVPGDVYPAALLASGGGGAWTVIVATADYVAAALDGS